MSLEDYKLVADITRAVSGESVKQVELDVDLAPLSEYVFFEGIRKNTLPAIKFSGGSTIKPLWEKNRQGPYIRGLSVTVDHKDSSHTEECGLELFKEAVKKATASLVIQGKLVEGEAFNYKICAFPSTHSSSDEDDFEVDAICEPLQIKKNLGYELFKNNSLKNSQASVWSGTDVPVFISDRVVADIESHCKQAGEMEAGGILLGHICKDSNNTFLVITAFIEAEYTEAKSTSLTFTPETWVAVDSALKLRRKNEQILGWAHSHPAFSWCKNCDDVRQSVCPLQKPFFSDFDRNVHRTAFPSAFMLAILFSIFRHDTSMDLFAWRNGDIKARGYYTFADSLVC